MEPATAAEPGPRLVIFTKPPVPGRVKTRLIGQPEAGGLTAEEAAALHRAFLGDVVEEMSAGPFDLRLAWSLEDDEVVPRLRDVVADLPASLGESGEPPGSRQAGADLGARLYQALAAAAGEAPLVAAIGSDHPELSCGTVAAAFAALAGGAPVVLVPASDGGYVLVGARREALSPRLFEGIAWSTDQVFATTLARCAELRLSAVQLAIEEDVDTPADLARLADRLARSERWGAGVNGEVSPAAPRSRALLRRLAVRLGVEWVRRDDLCHGSID